MSTEACSVISRGRVGKITVVSMFYLKVLVAEA